MSANDYRQLLHELQRLRSDDTEAHDHASRAVASDRERLAEVRSTIDETRSQLVETAGRVQAAVPDLRADDSAASPASDFHSELKSARDAVHRAGQAQQAAIRAAQLPPLLPRGHHFVRNLIVYGASMVGCFVVQLLVLGLIDLGAIPDTLDLWVVFILPLVFLLAGYVGTSVAGSPRLATTDAHGREIKFTVYKSPRLGVFLAVTTMIGAFLWNLG